MSRVDGVERAEAFDREWWKEAVVYQIYPRSFADSDGDGVGDLPGIVDRVDYLADLGVDAVWLNPVYESPQADNGYDISDYRAIDDAYGDMADWERLRDALHERDIRLIMDLVVNHTSDEHDWFQKSRRRDDGYEDYYHWRDGDPDDPPNNWESIFGGPAWSYDDERGQWYLHLFDESQPDLNWRNPDVREEVADVVEWWLEKGIDGFRMDAISHLAKTEGYPDGDLDESPVGSEHYAHGPGLGEYLDVLSDAVAGYDAMTVGEMGMTTIDQAADFVGADDLDMVFQFGHLGAGSPDGDWDPDADPDWDLTAFKEAVTDKQRELAWDALFLGNHDMPRLVSQFGNDDEHRRESAKLLATFLLTMRGTTFVYQGDELGMSNVEFESLDELDDPMALGKVEQLREAGVIESDEHARAFVNAHSRDHARTPVHWTDDDHAGFTDGDPWLRTGDDYAEVNVDSARADPDSVWHHYRGLIELRHCEDVLVYGDYDLLAPGHEQVFAYTRTLGEETVLVLLNWSDDPATFDAVEHLDGVDDAPTPIDVLAHNYDDPPAALDPGEFRPWEAVVYRL
jgi:oligo-1,6-glucosidase